MFPPGEKRKLSATDTPPATTNEALSASLGRLRATCEKQVEQESGNASFSDAVAAEPEEEPKTKADADVGSLPPQLGWDAREEPILGRVRPGNDAIESFLAGEPDICGVLPEGCPNDRLRTVVYLRWMQDTKQPLQRRWVVAHRLLALPNHQRWYSTGIPSTAERERMGIVIRAHALKQLLFGVCFVTRRKKKTDTGSDFGRQHEGIGSHARGERDGAARPDRPTDPLRFFDWCVYSPEPLASFCSKVFSVARGIFLNENHHMSFYAMMSSSVTSCCTGPVEADAAVVAVAAGASSGERDCVSST